MPSKPKTIDEYLAAVSPDQSAALEKLRKTIKAVVPKAEECISYGLAAFRLNGRPLVAFGATANHCAFYPMSGFTVEDHKDDLTDYDTSKGTIRFQVDKPLPAALVRKLVKARIAENEGQRGKTKEPRAAAKKRVAKLNRAVRRPTRRHRVATRAGSSAEAGDRGSPADHPWRQPRELDP